MPQPPAYSVASGSLPPGVPEDFYARLARLARERGSRFVLDASGPALAATLEALLAARDLLVAALAIPVTIASTVGAGDSFLGALVWRLASGACLEKRCGTASPAAPPVVILKTDSAYSAT